MGERIETIDIDYPAPGEPLWPDLPGVLGGFGAAPVRLALQQEPDGGARVYLRVGDDAGMKLIVGAVSARLFVLAGRRIEAHCAGLLDGWREAGDESAGACLLPAGADAGKDSEQGGA